MSLLDDTVGADVVKAGGDSVLTDTPHLSRIVVHPLGQSRGYLTRTGCSGSWGGGEVKDCLSADEVSCTFSFPLLLVKADDELR